ncbi:MAG TPA: hypothetical protein DC049_08120, partial [Spirochaetia bacterium]|nr:hypothetical protein [Spirochaetia bacterium]
MIIDQIIFCFLSEFNNKKTPEQGIGFFFGEYSLYIKNNNIVYSPFRENLFPAILIKNSTDSDFTIL